MPNHSGPWAPGTPCWCDLMTSDLAASRAFYGALLGWDFAVVQPGEYGGYTNALADGAVAAGLSPTPEGLEDAPHAWRVYLATDDSAATRAAVVAAGGSVVAEPMQVGPMGTMGLYADPAGAVVGTWESGEHSGFARYDEPGTAVWLDLMSRDFEASQAFYAAAFGYRYSDVPSQGMRYVMFSVPGGERPAGGIGDLGNPDGSPAGTAPSAWTVCFQHPDVDVAASQVTGLGGSLLGEPSDIPFGRFVGLSGPDGEVFYLLTPPAA